MSVRGSPAKIALVLRRYANALEANVRRAEAESAQEALKIAVELSSGGLSRGKLRALGHPYATRSPRPPGDAAVIHRQSGAFASGWRILAPRKTAKGLVTRLVNSSPQAVLLSQGTSRMIARPIIARIRQRLEQKRARLLRAALRDSIR